MRIIFSKNRAAQLDLLLRSLDQHAWREDTRIIWYADTRDFLAGYLLLNQYGQVEPADYKGSVERPHGVLGRITPPSLFDRDLRIALASAGTLVTFFCDDDIVFRKVPWDPASYFRDEKLLAWSWRVACEPPNETWAWEPLPRTDRGYPGSIDGHTFRTADVVAMIDGVTVMDPHDLETLLVAGCEEVVERRPLLGAFPEQVLVSAPVNRVASRSGCPFGEIHPQTAEELNRKFLDGDRITIPPVEFIHGGCHEEILFAWDHARVPA